VTRAAAFFDMDRTVLRVNSGSRWMSYLRRRGEITRFEALRAVGWAMQYKLAVLDMDTLSRRLVAGLAGDSESEMRDKCAAWFREEIEATIVAPARAAIDLHRARGERVVLLTSATPYVAEPLARALALDAVLCSRLEVVDGRFTGRLVNPLCFGAGKVAWAEQLAASEGIDLAASSFYTDSYNDLPMMLRVGVPIAVNPDLRLALAARRRGWRIERWEPK
jgi:HAD superfamily hydrolase (TIGR01490 family)